MNSPETREVRGTEIFEDQRGDPPDVFRRAIGPD